MKNILAKYFVKNLVVFLPLVLLLNCQLVWAAPALSLDFKALPDDFVSGTQVELTLYLVENRDASETGLFEGPYNSTPPLPGPFPLASVDSNLTSLQSTFISFTPVAGFDKRRDVFVQDHFLSFGLTSTDGIPVVTDNSGITGRTEIPLGTVKMMVGAPIPNDDGIGDPEPDTLFFVDFSADRSGSNNAGRYLKPDVFQALGGIVKNTFEATAISQPTPDPITPTGNAGIFSLALSALTFVAGTEYIYPAFDCSGTKGDECSGTAKLFKKKKIVRNGRRRKRVVTYGKCDIRKVYAPTTTYCEMKLRKSALKLLRKGKSLKGKLQFSTDGQKRKSKEKVVIEPFQF